MKNLILIFSFIFIFTTANLFAQTDEPIRVGVYGDLTGATSIFGNATFNGVKLAFAVIQKLNPQNSLFVYHSTIQP